jgi:hypothetical protein
LRTGCCDEYLDQMREDVTGGWRKLHEEFYYLFFQPNIIRVIKSMRARCTEHEACMENMKNLCKISLRKT